MANIHLGDEGELEGKFAIVVSKYNDSITSKLLDGALETLKKAGVSDDDIDVLWVPGAWELPLATKWVAQDKDVIGVITLGAVIRGDTTHDQHINRAVSQQLMQMAVQSSKPIGFGLLTVNTLDQAIQRAGGNVGNKGVEAAEAVVQMIRLGKNVSEEKSGQTKFGF
jgi:6,7-dimethyl-8-ribityllumazine synthase